MTESCSESMLGSWTPPECPFKISYSLRTADDIRLAVMDAFFSLPRGGAEIGGILLGKRDAKGTTILDHLPLDCEHAFGPSFSLSPRDLANFSRLIEDARKNVPDLQPAGWYHSHTRSEIFLSDADLDIYKRFFPHPWQVALVMKPHTFQPMRAGFFFREQDGTYRTESSYQEFILDALPAKQIPSGNAPRPEPGEIRLDAPPSGHVISVPAMPATEETERLPADPPLSPPPVPATAPVEWPSINAGSFPAADPIPAAEVPPPPEMPMGAVLASNETSDAVAEESPMLYREVEAPRRWRFTVVLGLAAGLAVGAFAFETRSAWLPHVWNGGTAPASQPKVLASLGLDLKDQDGELRILWDRKNPAVAAATRGTLEISAGGGLPSATKLDIGQLSTGVFNYKREAERVDVSLSVDGAAGELGRESASFLGKLPDNARARGPNTADPAVTSERDQLAVEVERLKSELKAEVAKNQQLSKSIDVRGGMQDEVERLRNLLNAEMLKNRDLEKAVKPKDDQLAKLRSDLALQIAHNRVLGESLDAANAQLRLQQKKRMGNQTPDTGKQ